jgi:type I restriction enzyme, S subunit
MRWPLMELGQMAEIAGGATPRRDNAAYWGGVVPWLTPTDLPAVGAGVTDVAATAEAITDEGLASCSANLLPPGTVLFSSRASIGKVGIAAIPLTTNQGFANLIPRQGVESRYLAWCLHFHAERISGLAGSTTFKEVSKSALKRFRVPLPPPSEQRHIVGILDQADRLRRLSTEADAKADRILQALFIKMIGDPATNPKRWPVRTLGELAILGPQYGANARSMPLSPGQPRYVRITDIADDGRLRPFDAVGIELDEWEQYKLMEGDLLFARSGATVGKSYLHRSENGASVFAGYLIRFRLDLAEIEPIVAFGFTQTAFYRAWVGAKQRTAAQPNINGQEYASLRLPVPARSIQEHFASLCSSIESTRQALSSSSHRLESLFSVLLHRAFSGDLTASWRAAHMNELLPEMEHQAKALAELTP